MRAAYLLAFTASLAAALSSLFLLPARVAVHFGPGGLPDGWGSSTTHVAFLVGLHLILFGVFFFGHRLVLRIPPRELKRYLSGLVRSVQGKVASRSTRRVLMHPATHSPTRRSRS